MDSEGPKKRRLSSSWQGRPRLQDVALGAGVSTATVSRVINGSPLVAAGVQERVHRAMSNLGYVPNSAARTLRSRRSRMVGIVVPTLNYALYARLVGALESKLNEHSYGLLVATCEYDQARENSQIQLLLQRGAEAIVLIGEARAPDTYTLLDQWHVPYIINYVYNGESSRACIGFDNFSATARAASYLLDLGHRTFGVLPGITRGNDRTSARLAGVRATLEAAGLKLPQRHVVESPYGIEHGRAAFRKLMTACPDVTALICSNDILAIGGVLEAQALGMTVPRDISIIGIDDLELASQLKPALSTIRVPAGQMGELSAQYIVEWLNGGKTTVRQCLDAELIQRGTTAPPPRRTAKTARKASKAGPARPL